MSKPAVPAVNGMTMTHFHKHMNMRHVGLDNLVVSFADPPITEMVRGDHWVSVAYHNHLHRSNPNKYDHKHNDLEES